jgi:hypothetical protein
MAQQMIIEAQISPDVGAIQVTLVTAHPCKPFFTVWRRLTNDPVRDMVASNQVAVSGSGDGGAQTSHVVTIGNLPQGVFLWLRVNANAEDLSPSDPARLLQADFQTGTYVRTCVARILSTEVLNSGDPGGGATMMFQFQIYNGSSGFGEPLIPLKQSSVDSIDNGEFVGDLAGLYKIDSAPDVIVPYMAALHFAGGIFHIRTQGTLVAPPTLPDTTASGSNDDYQWAECMGRAALPKALGDTVSPAFSLSTGLAVPAIAATLTFETNVQNPLNIQATLQISTSGPHFLG